MFPDTLPIRGPNKPRVILGGFLWQTDRRGLILSAYAAQKAVSLGPAYLWGAGTAFGSAGFRPRRGTFAEPLTAAA